jgi:hypothetical protein
MRRPRTIAIATAAMLTLGTALLTPTPASANEPPIHILADCSQTTNIPWTWVKGACGPNYSPWTAYYQAWIDCQYSNGNISRSYGQQRTMPRIGKGPASTAQCLSGGRGVNGGIDTW